eukprot:3693543-Pyramimonas_sp.AAC.1
MRVMCKKGVRLDVDLAKSLRPMNGDKTRIQQIMGNLLGNAAKFTLKGCIKLSAAMASDDMVKVSTAPPSKTPPSPLQAPKPGP